MNRWIVAGVLLAVLVGLILMDEFGSEPVIVAPAGPTDVAAVEGAVTEPSVVDQEAKNAAEEVERVRRQADEACQGLVPGIEGLIGVERMDVIGSALYEKAGLTPEQVAALCRSLEGQPPEVVVAKLTEAAGLQP